MENEAGFVRCFRLLIQAERLSPERSQRQLAAILRRVCGERPGINTARTGGMNYEQ
ncbi:MAG: hypothetical protein J5789_02360 [Oscillospiraceae bacterium]|nr:hypothetical protein [Oscillospiraceae bacterium]